MSTKQRGIDLIGGFSVFKRIASVLLAFIMFIGVCPQISFAATDTGGFTLTLKWNGDVLDSENYQYDTGVSDSRFVRLKVAYKNTEVTNGYAPGEIVITVPGLSSAVRSGGAGTPAAIAADRASLGTRYYDWSYTYSSTTDTYTFTNNYAIEPNSTFEGSFEIVWSLSSRTTRNYYSTNIVANLRTSKNEQVSSNTVSYSQSRVKDTYALSGSASALYGAEGLASEIDSSDYVWVKYGVSGTRSEKSLGVKGTERLDFWFLQGAIVQGGLTKTGETKIIDGKTYECWSVDGTVRNDIFVAYPKNLYSGTVTTYVEMNGTFNEETVEEVLATTSISVNLEDYGFLSIPGNIYTVNKRSYGMNSNYINSHCSHCYTYGAINSEHLFNADREYNSRFDLNLNYRPAEAESYDLEFIDDFLDIALTNGTMRLLQDHEYHFTKASIPSNSSVTNINGFPVRANVYDVEVYIRRAGAAGFEISPFNTTKITTTSQSIELPTDTVGVKIIIRGVTESMHTSGLGVSYKFHADYSNSIYLNGGRMINNIIFNLYNQSGSLVNSEYGGDNPATYVNPDGTQNTYAYDRDIAKYGQTFERKYGYNHILDIPNEFNVSNTLTRIGETQEIYAFTESITTTFSIADGNSLSQFSNYTIIPAGMELSNLYRTPEKLLDALTFSATGLNDAYIRERCTIEMIEDYKGSGRVYIGFHFDFSDSSIIISNLGISGIPAYVAKDSLTTTSRTFIAYAAALIDQQTGKWHSRSVDNSTLEDGVWRDIDRDGNTTEVAAFSSANHILVHAESSNLQNTKSVETGITNGYVQPRKENDEYIESEIPYVYPGYEYSYKLRIKTGESRAQNIVFYDVLETGPNSQWNGEFISVDYLDAQSKLGVVPTIYYSTQVENVYPTEPNLQSGNWTTSNLGMGVRSIAVAFSGGEELKEGEYLHVIINMRAPIEETLLWQITENNHVVYYDNIDSESGNTIGREDLPSNNVPVKLVPYLGTITLNKVDATNRSAIKGAVFSLYKMTGEEPNGDEDILIGSGYVTDGGGRIRAPYLEYGEYYFVETAAIKGYQLDVTPIRVTLNGLEPDTVATVTFENQRKPGQFSIKKVSDRIPSLALAGARFSVYTADGTLVQDNLVTDVNGELTVSGLAWGDYYLQEEQAPSGYLICENINFTISAENDSGHDFVRVTVVDEQIPASVIMTKYEVLEDGTTRTSTVLNGAAYKLYRTSDSKDLGTYMTDSQGKIYVDDLTFGDYFFKETVAAQGYSLNPDQIHFTVNAAHSIIPLAIETTDTRLKGRVWLQKLDDAGAAVNGAVYGLFDTATSSLLGQYTTNSEGILTIEDMLWGDYYIEEIASPQGYELSTERHHVLINREQVNYRVIVETVNIRGKGAVQLKKVSEEDEELTLPGAVFTLYRTDGSIYADDLVTDSNGLITLTDVEWGSYYFMEKTAPAGYGLNPEKIRFSINYMTAGKMQELIVTDPELSCNLVVTKKIKTSEIVFAHGAPTFTFKVVGPGGRTYYKTIVFGQEYINVNSGSTYIEQSVTFVVPEGTYTVWEMGTVRYDLSDITAVNGTAYADNAVFTLTEGVPGEAIFTNDKIVQSDTSHTSQLTNVVKVARKLTGIVAVWKGSSTVESETLDRTKLDVFAVYDDGEQVKLADDAYDVDPETFDGSMNGNYTVNVIYTERGVTRRDSFDLFLNVPLKFTWSVLSSTSFEEDGITYDGTVAITGYFGTSDYVVFPTVVKGIQQSAISYLDNGLTYKVVRIGTGGTTTSSILSGFSGVKSIRIPEGIVEIGNYAFYNYIGLTGDLIIPDSVTSIGLLAFYNCSGFTGSLIIPDSVTTIENQAFYNCSGFTGSLIIPDGVTLIDNSAFYGCSGLTGSLIIPDSVTTIGSQAFYDCRGFKGSLIIGDSVTTIGSQAFQGCSGFTGSLIIPDSVTLIDGSAFRSCSGLTGSLIIPDSVTTIGQYAFYNCSGFTGSLIIPDSVTTIGQYTFYNCSGFTGSLIIPDGVTTIGRDAFYQCSGFTGSLTIPDSVTTIGQNAFSICEGFNGSLIIGDSVTTIGSNAFYNCRGFTGSLIIPDSVTTISGMAFYGCRGFNGSLIIGDSVTTIGSQAFQGCFGFTGSLIIPDSVTLIDDSAFSSCSGLTGSLIIGDSVTTIGSNAFFSCGFTNGNGSPGLIIPASVATIRNQAFRSCSGFMGTIVIPITVTSYGTNVFQGCSVEVIMGAGAPIMAPPMMELPPEEPPAPIETPPEDPEEEDTEKSALPEDQQTPPEDPMVPEESEEMEEDEPPEESEE